MAKKLFLLVLVVPLFLLAACGDGSGDTSATTPEATQAAPDLVDAGMAINGEINDSEAHDPGALRCVEAKNCTLSGMQCDVDLFKLCKQFGRVDENAEVLPEYLGD